MESTESVLSVTTSFSVIRKSGNLFARSLKSTKSQPADSVSPTPSSLSVDVVGRVFADSRRLRDGCHVGIEAGTACVAHGASGVGRQR